MNHRFVDPRILSHSILYCRIPHSRLPRVTSTSWTSTHQVDLIDPIHLEKGWPKLRRDLISLENESIRTMDVSFTNWMDRLSLESSRLSYSSTSHGASPNVQIHDQCQTEDRQIEQQFTSMDTLRSHRSRNQSYQHLLGFKLPTPQVNRISSAVHQTISHPIHWPLLYDTTGRTLGGHELSSNRT